MRKGPEDDDKELNSCTVLSNTECKHDDVNIVNHIIINALLINISYYYTSCKFL